MRIGINAYEANVTNRVGSNLYAYRVLVELEKIASNDDVVIYMATPPVEDMPKERPGWKYVVLTPAFLWSQWRLPLELLRVKFSKKPFDVFFSLGHYAPRVCPFPSVISIMDVAYLKFPEFFKSSDVWKLTQWTAYSAAQAKHVITISEQSKRDILEFYHKKPEEVTVAYPGFDGDVLHSEHTLAKKTLEKFHLDSPFIVYIGTIQPRKNLVRLVQAFELLKKKEKYAHLQLVIGGKVGWLAQEFREAVDGSAVKQAIHLLGFVSDEEKYHLYAASRAAVLVGLYEGFGIPPLEAMAAGTLPVVSETASLPEVVGPDGIMVDPYSAEDIARGLEEAIECKGKEREQRVEKARSYMKKFSWLQSAESILHVLYEVGRKSI